VRMKSLPLSAFVVTCGMLAVGCSGSGAAVSTPTGSGTGGDHPAGGSGAVGNLGGASSGVDSSGTGGTSIATGIQTTVGTTFVGGAATSGGNTSAGGTVSSGRTKASTGTTVTGGATSATLGGATSIGGSVAAGGTKAGGGTVSTGGNVTTGGAKSGGGSTSTSGSTGTGGTSGNGGSTGECPAFAVPATSSLASISELPDPFTFMSGTRMTSKDEWTCRREELSELIQAFEYGSYPPKPDSVTGTLSGTTLTVQVQCGGKSITFTPTVTLPSGNGPFPVYIGLSGEGYDAPFAASVVTPMGIAHISYNTDDIATDAPGKGGNFYTLYGTSVTAGVLMAWGWGVHRIVDALEQIPTFNATKVAVNGFSRWGKGALVAGAFDERIALTIASSSGAGGIGSWRSADVQNSSILAADAQASGVQTLFEVTDEAPHWFATAFKGFRNKTKTLPFDGHSVAALVAPRPLLVTESNDDTWNNPIGCYTSAVAAHKVWEFLGIPDSMGFAAHNNGGHGFGEFTESQAFINKFILGKSANTTVMENPGNYTVSSSDIPWSVP
jgi:hypothetical protein